MKCYTVCYTVCYIPTTQYIYILESLSYDIMSYYILHIIYSLHVHTLFYITCQAVILSPTRASLRSDLCMYIIISCMLSPHVYRVI